MLSALLLLLWLPAAAADRSGPVPPALPRSAVVSGFEKKDLPVVMTLSAERRADLMARHRQDDPRLAEVVKLYKGTEASRSMAVTEAGLRGPATRTRIVVAEKKEGGLS